MKEEIIKRYIAFDGTPFNTKKECLAYEDCTKARQAIAKSRTVFEKVASDCGLQIKVIFSIDNTGHAAKRKPSKIQYEIKNDPRYFIEVEPSPYDVIHIMGRSTADNKSAKIDLPFNENGMVFPSDAAFAFGYVLGCMGAMPEIPPYKAKL